jgi:hypothetical protein
MVEEGMRILVPLLAGAALAMGAALFGGRAAAQYPENEPIAIWAGWFDNNQNYWVQYQQADGSTYWVCQVCGWPP